MAERFCSALFTFVLTIVSYPVYLEYLITGYFKRLSKIVSEFCLQLCLRGKYHYFMNFKFSNGHWFIAHEICNDF